jgi:predicted GNAT family acetyltransferase
VSDPHPLDRPIWSALTGLQAHLSLGSGAARRFAPEFAMFAASADHSPASLADLARLAAEGGPVLLMEPKVPPSGAGLVVISEALGWQMVAEEVAHGVETEAGIVALGDAEASEMLHLATLTKPGPFFARTHELGRFVGVKEEGRLVAMAGERLRAPGFTEVSGVCTHPDHRGHGHAAALMRHVARRILARGERPFLHSYASNKAAIALYERLSFRFRQEVIVTTLSVN